MVAQNPEVIGQKAEPGILSDKNKLNKCITKSRHFCVCFLIAKNKKRRKKMKQKIKRLMSIMVAVALILGAALPVQAQVAETGAEDMPPQYRLQIEQSEGGILKAEPEKDAYTPGEEIVLTVEAQDGYILSQIQSDPQQHIKLDELKVKMPAQDLLLKPMFEKVVQEQETAAEQRENETIEETADVSMGESGNQQDEAFLDQDTNDTVPEGSLSDTSEQTEESKKPEESVKLEEEDKTEDTVEEAADEHEKLLISPKLLGLPSALASRAVGIVYNGEVTYKGTTVGAFTVNGNIAFCMEHMKSTPNTGTSFYESIYDNSNIRKVLYYGWAGHEQWSGFSSYEQGVVCTSLALSYYYSGPGSLGGDPFLGDNWMSPLGDFIRFCEAQSDPNVEILNLTKSYVESFLSPDKKYQMTEDITLNADVKNTVTFPLSEGVELVNKTTGQTLSGNVTVKGGDTFYLKAPLSMNGTWRSGQCYGSMGKFNAVLAITGSGNLQDLGYGQYAIDPDHYVQLSVKWVQMGDIRITKFLESDDEIKTPATGAEFTLTHQETGEKVIIVVDENGVATTEDRENYPGGRLIGGVWRVEETKPVEGYKPIEPFEVTITGQGQVFSFIAEDKEIYAAIRIVKTDAESGLVIPVAGARFQILDKDKNPIKMIISHYPDLNETDTFETDENGSFVLPEKLQHGDYYLHEVQAPEGYLLGLDDIPFTVDAMTDWDTPLTIEYADVPAKGKIRIEKTDEATGDPLAGAEFTVMAAEDITTPDGTIHVNAGDVVATIVTDDNGIAETSALYLGKYAVKETGKLPGYILPEQSWDVELKYKDQHTDLVVETLNITNKPTEVIIRKTETGTDQPLAGIEFTVWNKAFESDAVDLGMAVKETYITDNDGTILLSKLQPGTYCVQETATLPGYVLDDTVREFTINENGMFVAEDGAITETGTLEFVNDYTKLHISKQDATTGKELPGARMELRDTEGNLVAKWTSGDKPYVIERIKPGDYILHEEAAPAGYKLAKDISFTVEETGVVQKIVMEDEYSVGSLKVSMPGNGWSGVKTGDIAHIAPYVIAVIIAGTAVIILIRKKRKGNKDDEK